MRQFREVAIRKRTRLFDDEFCKVDELMVSHQKLDGSMSADQRRLIFERGDSAAVLLFNTDRKCLVLVKQFKAPTLGKGLEGGWVAETVAGIIEPYEAPEATAVRETFEETGYKIKQLKLIAEFFSSPGGTSERIYLYYAAVRDEDKKGDGGGRKDEGEDIEVLHVPLSEVVESMSSKQIEDPKLLIGAMWLNNELKREARTTLEHSCVKCSVAKYPDRFIGYQTGSISDIKDVRIWVNSENEDMIMDRFIGRSISASIRYLGADKDSAGNITEDLINDELVNQIGRRALLRIGTVIETSSGMLNVTHGVDAVFHVATVRGAGAGRGVRADVDDLARCVDNVLMKAEERNGHYRWLKRHKRIAWLFGMRNADSILIPMIGGGDGGLPITDIAPKLFSAAAQHLNSDQERTVKEIYFIAFSAEQKHACDREIECLRKSGIIG
jgi:nudix-type nucleoside diphosphatase (YffH/AdpP family)